MPKSGKRILIYRIGSLGDTVIALPAFHQVLKAFPDADITLLTNRPLVSKAAPVESVLGAGHFFHRVINYPTGTRDLGVLIQLIKEIRSLQIDVAINLTTTRILKNLTTTKIAVWRDMLFFKAAGIKKLVGFPKVRADFELSVDQQTGDLEWEAKRLSRRLTSIGEIDLESNSYWDLCFSDEEVNLAKQRLQYFSFDKPILAACAGTKMQSKDWEENNWLKLFEELKFVLPDAQLVMVGAPDEFERATKCLAAWAGPGINLCGKTSPRVSGAVLQYADIFIGHDSGPMHLAAAVGTPCVAIYSARNIPRQWYPRGNFNKIIYHKTDCAGCYLETCIIQKKKCILSVTVDEVIEATLDILAKK